MKWGMSVKDITTIGICITIALVLGKLLGIFHKVVPFSRGVINAPIYSFIVAVLVYRVKKPGAIILFSLGYGLIMARISIFITLSVIVGGILGDLVTFIFARGYNSNIKIALCAPVYSVGGIVATFFITTLLIKSSLYTFEGSMALLISSITVYFSGLVGSSFAMRIFPRRLLY